MAYATPQELADALELRLTPENEPVLTDCLEAAADEIDHCVEVFTNPVPALVVRTNVNRAVEWYKAPATYNGGVGFADVGILVAPRSGFERHAAALLPLQTSWGVA
jgi:hypothetical protein